MFASSKDQERRPPNVARLRTGPVRVHTVAELVVLHVRGVRTGRHGRVAGGGRGGTFVVAIAPFLLETMVDHDYNNCRL